jgi:hypothetical protein
MWIFEYRELIKILTNQIHFSCANIRAERIPRWLL